MTTLRQLAIITILGVSTALAGCSGEKVVDRTVDSTLWVGKTAVKGTVGAGKLVVRGASRALGADGE